MIRCPNCRSEEYPGSLFCAECGAQLVNREHGWTAPGKTQVQLQESAAPIVLEKTAEEESTVSKAEPVADPEAPVTLYIVDAGQTMSLKGGSEFTLGRVSAGQPLIPEVDLSPFGAYEQGVSRLHAVIGVHLDHISITDLGSANGTRVNGVRIAPHTPHPLKNGDLVTFGTLKIQPLFRN